MYRSLFRVSAAVGMMCATIVSAFACDLCASAGGGASLGLLPLVQRHFVGVRWQTQAFYTDAHGSDPNSNDNFHTFDVWGRWQPHRRVQCMAVIPFQYNARRFEDGTSVSVKGWGDVSALVQFSILDPVRQSARSWQHTLQLGGGIKLPTGHFNSTSSEYTGSNLPALQPGTGSTDVMCTGLYAIRKGVWGASADMALRYAGTNQLAYRFGNRLNASGRLFRSITTKKTNWMPYAGASLDMRQRDSDAGNTQWDTGGKAVFGTFGIETFRNNVSLHAGVQCPLYSTLSNGYVKPRFRTNISVVWLLGKNSKKMPLQRQTLSKTS